jgi:phosphoribosylformylglycinamidine synthase
VNAFCLGLVKTAEIFKGAADGVGNPVFYVGAKTGRDGIHGATMASAEFGEGSEERRPTVQVGDPFMEKVLLEACLEVLKTGAVVGIQDMGAGGPLVLDLRDGSPAGTGIEIDIQKVPMRETGMTAYEVLLSESQERMLLVAQKGREKEITDVFAKWDLHAENIGTVTASPRLRVFNHGKLEADVPNGALTDDAPIYDRPWVEWKNPAAAEDVLALAAAGGPRRCLAAGVGFAHGREQALDLPAVRQHRAHQHPGGPRLGRRCRARQGHQQGPGHEDRLQCPLLLARPLRGRSAGRG